MDYNKLTKANVYLREELAGSLEKMNPKKFVFKYTAEWIRSEKGGIALSLPPRQEESITENLHPFFDNLIPEGWLLAHAQKVHKIDKANRFSMLLATGSETVGAVKVMALAENGEEIFPLLEELLPQQDEEKYPIFFDNHINHNNYNKRCSYCLNPLTGKQAEKLKAHPKCIGEMWGTQRKLCINLKKSGPAESFRQTIYGSSISGAQKKGLFRLKGGILYPANKETLYILKPQGDYENLPENEHVTMAIAKKIGFDLPPFSLFSIPALSKLGLVFAIKRFDIHKEERLRMEDAAQILNRPSAYKYESSNEQVAKLILKYSFSPVVDLYDFWRRLLFSFFIGNGDMHLKNWSLLELGSKRGQFKLSPCYDFLNTRLPIPKESIDIGLTINGKSKNLKKSYFINFAKELKIYHLIDETLGNLPYWLEITQDFVANCFLDKEKKGAYLKIVNERYKSLI